MHLKLKTIFDEKKEGVFLLEGNVKGNVINQLVVFTWSMRDGGIYLYLNQKGYLYKKISEKEIIEITIDNKKYYGICRKVRIKEGKEEIFKKKYIKILNMEQCKKMKLALEDKVILMSSIEEVKLVNLQLNQMQNVA